MEEAFAQPPGMADDPTRAMRHGRHLAWAAAAPLLSWLVAPAAEASFDVGLLAVAAAMAWTLACTGHALWVVGSPELAARRWWTVSAGVVVGIVLADLALGLFDPSSAGDPQGWLLGMAVLPLAGQAFVARRVSVAVAASVATCVAVTPVTLLAGL